MPVHHRVADDVLHSVDLELHQLALSTDSFVRDVCAEAELVAAQVVRPRSEGSARESLSLSPSRRVPRRPAPEAAESRAEPSLSALDEDEDNEGEGEGEEVKMSHELLAEPQEQQRVADSLSAQFQQLQRQVEQYKALYKASFEKLKDAETRAAELESRLEDVEEDRAQLVAQLQSSDAMQDAVQDRTPAALALSALASPAAFRPQHATNNDLNKRSDAMRRALLSEHDEDDAAAVAVDALLHPHKKSLCVSLGQLQALLTPFRADIRNIQARFGSSVASYFVYYRFM